MTIKVGQVYKYTAEPSTRFVVTAAFDENTRFDYIQNDVGSRTDFFDQKEMS